MTIFVVAEVRTRTSHFIACAIINRNNALLTAAGATVTARILNGSSIRDQIYAELQQEIAALGAAGIRPGLAAVLVGENAASQIYVRSKIAACEQLGLGSWLHTPPATVTTEEMLALVAQLNARDDVDGILVQLPLPAQVDTKRVLEAVDPSKDVDGFHPVNLGRLVSGAGRVWWRARQPGPWKFCGAAAFPSMAPMLSSLDAATSWVSPWLCF